MHILVDTREQNPLTFSSLIEEGLIEGVISRKLDVGDYGCEFKDGFIPPLFFERKSKGDLYSTLSKGYKRFKREIVRAKDNCVGMTLVVEGSWESISEGYRYSTRNPKSIVLQLATLCYRYGIVTWFCTSREEMEKRIFFQYLAIWRDHTKKAKDGADNTRPS